MAVVVSDAMTGSNWQDLNERSGAVGASWTYHPQTPLTRWYIYGNKVHCGVAGAAYASGVPASADYTVSCDYTVYTDIASISICGRMSTSADTMYYVYYLNNELVLVKRVAGAITTLGTWPTTLSTGGTTYQLELDMSGTTIRALLNGVERISVTDGDITAAGRAGVRSAGSNDSGTGKHIDNFLVEDASVAASPRSYAVGLLGL
jgi:hypothetical protein